MGFPLPTQPSYLIAVYATVGVGLLLLIAGLLYVFCSKRYRINWWDRSLLDQHKSHAAASDTSYTASRDCDSDRHSAARRFSHPAPSGSNGVGASVVRICCSSRRRLGSEDSSDDETEGVCVGSGVAVTVSPPVVLTSDPEYPDYIKQYRSVSVPNYPPSERTQSSYGAPHPEFFSPSQGQHYQNQQRSGSIVVEKDFASLEPFRKHSTGSTEPFRKQSTGSEPFRNHPTVSDHFRKQSTPSDPFRKHSSVSDTFPAHRVFTASDSTRELLSSETSLRRDSYNSYSSVGPSSLSVPYASIKFPVPSLPVTHPTPSPSTALLPSLEEPKSGDLGEWLKYLATRCMAGVAGRGLLGRSATTTSSPSNSGSGGPQQGRGSEWLQSVRKMGSSPSSPVADASEKFWVPPGVLERKRAQSLVPALSRQGSDDDAVSSGAGTPASNPPLRELSFSFSNEKVPGQSSINDGLPSTPPAGYVPRRRASMHDAIDYTKIDARLYDKKLVRQASVKSIEEENLGSLNFSLDLDPETNILTVHIIQARNLVPRDFSGTADPYVKVSLLPDQRSASAQSKTHRKTVNPVFDEEFIFELKDSGMARAVLEILVFDYDQFSQDECIGCVKTPLRSLDLSEHLEMWKGIQAYEKDTDKDRDVGDVMFSLSYLPSAERLTVVVVKARNLKHPETSKDTSLDPYVKVAVMAGSKKAKKKKTATWHNTNNPVWNEALVFNLARDQLHAISLEVSVFHDNKLGNDERLGKVRLSSESSGEEKAHWQDVVRERSASARWHKLT